MTTADENYGRDYQLDCGRWVTVEECYISTSSIGILAGSEERIRRHLIEDLPKRVQNQFGHVAPVYIKPMPEGLPHYVFMVYLLSDLISKSPHNHNHSSMLVVCWLSDDITTSLLELIKRETRAIEWNKYAVDFCY